MQSNKRPSLVLQGFDNCIVDNSKTNITDDYNFINEIEDICSQNTLILAKSKLSGLEVVVKRLSKLNIIGNNLILNEINALRELTHPKIINIIDVYEDVRWVFIITEYHNLGDLAGYLLDKGRVNETVSCNIISQLLQTISCIHKKGYIHRDMKPDNILLCDELSNQDSIIICDFGSSTKIQNRLRGVIGTHNYMAPEIVNSLIHTPTCDCWSIGVIMHLCLFGDYPTTHNIYNPSIEWCLPKYSNISEDALSVLKGLLTVNPDNRLTCNEAMEMDWFRNLTVKSCFKCCIS